MKIAAKLLNILSTLTLFSAAILHAENQVQDLATEAYIYAYPLITMDMTRRVMTNVAEPENHHAPMGQFYNSAEYPNASFRDVTAPNADTLYSTAWLDLSKEPYILHVPDENGRYYLMPMLSGWTNVFAVPGTRTTGTEAGDFAITGPNWKGKLPDGVKEIKSPTDMVWILGRTYSTGTAEDYKAVHDIQKQYSLVPLSFYGKSYTAPKGTVNPSIDMNTAVRDQVHSMEGVSYFKKFSELLKSNPPSVEDKKMVENLAKIGIVPGQELDTSKLSPTIISAMKEAPARGLEKIINQQKNAGKKINGWHFSTKTGSYGTDYLQRALVAAIGLGANLPQDAIYPFANQDSDGHPLNGANKYIIHFAKGQTPKVKGFWSITMYNDKYYFVDNPINRYAISPRNSLKYNGDGSLDIYVQNEMPEKEKESNWLPAPKGNFVLMLRMYWPDQSVIDESWTPPVIKNLSTPQD